MKVKLENVRLAFPDLFKPRAFNGEGEAKYGATFLFPPDHPVATLIKQAIETAAKEKWQAKAPAILKALWANGNVCLHDGNTKEELDGYAGNLYVSARSSVRPGVYDRDKTPLTEADGRPYGGCYVNSIIEIWAQDNGYGKRVNAALKGVQFLRDGEPFAGGAPASPDDFDVVEEEEESLI